MPRLCPLRRRCRGGFRRQCAASSPAPSPRGWPLSKVHRSFPEALWLGQRSREGGGARGGDGFVWHADGLHVGLRSPGGRRAGVLFESSTSGPTSHIPPGVGVALLTFYLGQASCESMREVGAVRLDQMVLLVNTALLHAHLSAGVGQRSVFVNVHRSLAAPRVRTSGRKLVTVG